MSFNVEVLTKLKEGVESPPIYATQGAAGFDFQSNEDIVIRRYDTVLIKTGISVSIPEGYEIQVRSRSGLAIKKQVFVLNSPGTIDSDFTGEICIILTNAGHEDFVIKKGDRIAQGVLSPVFRAVFKVVDSLEPTDRGTAGFGSTGV